jgi:dipeptidyl aminopeptidase/acylaminoacyl peptidase
LKISINNVTMNRLICTLLACTFIISALAQKAITAQDYQRAESFLNYNTQKYIDHTFTNPNWSGDDRFWYRTLTPQGSEFILIDPVKKKRSAAFDADKLAAAISSVTKQQVKASTLPFNSFAYSDDNNSIIFRVNGQTWKANLQNYAINKDTAAQVNNRGQGFRRRSNSLEVFSPDGTKTAYIKDWNLWVRDIKTGNETQLTKDGIKDFGYATDNAGWKHTDAAILRWSPDSKKIATFKQDQRQVGDMYLVSTKVGHPKLEQWKYPLPGDAQIPMITRVIIDVENPKVITLNIPPDPHRATLEDDIAATGTFDDVDWSEDGNWLAFVSTSRDHKNEKFRIANAATGEVRDVFEENVRTQYESGWGNINWKFLSKTNEIIWFSEKDNWGHLYLYDAATGKIKNQITRGDFVVSEMLKADDKTRTIYFYAFGLQKENPYYRQLYKINFDGKGMTLLTSGDGYHTVAFSPSGKYIVDTWSKPDAPPVTVVRDLNGKQLVELERTDVSRLKATGWKPPTPITVKAHDGVTDIYGLLYTPIHVDPSKKYPIIDYIYPGPQGGSMGGQWGFSASRNDHQSLAELGFCVLVLEGTSNPWRSKSFHDMYFPDMSENTLPDQVTGIRQLAQRYSYIDTTRVGIWGHSGGGFATAAAMFRYPDFFKVGISESGNHDNRNYEDDWGERYVGLLKKNADGTDNYAAQANQLYAKNLKGKLLLAHGMMDDNVPPTNTMLVIDALEKAGKDYDLIVFPNARHGYGDMSNYMMRRRWDYFVKNLMGAEPPKEYQLQTQNDPRNVIPTF